MESTILMDMLFSDETPDAKKDAVSQKITEAIQTGSSQLKDGTQDLTLVKQGDNLVKIQDNKSGESTLAKCNSDGSHDLVAENEVNQTEKTFSNMDYTGYDYYQPQERLFTESELEQELAEERYFSKLESGVERIFSDIDSLENREYTFSDIEDAYQDLEILYSELSDLGSLGYDVEEAMEATLCYSEYLQDLAEQELIFSETVKELADATDEVKDGIKELIDHPTDGNKEDLKDKIEDLQDAAKEYSDVLDTSDLIEELAYFSDFVECTLTFSDIEDLREDVKDLKDAVDELHDTHDGSSEDDEVTHKVKALSEEARIYADAAEEQGHDVDDIHDKLDEIQDKLDDMAVEQVKQGVENKSFSTTYVDSYLTTPIR